MKMRLKKIKIIVLLIFLVTGLSITGWSISTHYDMTFKNAESQKELQENSQAGNIMPKASSSSKPILFLISTGLIGLVGVRRQRKTQANQQSRNIPEIKNNSGKVELSKQEKI